MKISRFILIALLVLIVTTVIASCSTGGSESTDDNAKEDSASKSKKTEEIKDVPKERPSATRGKAIYDEHCIECHGETGAGEGEKSDNFKDDQKDFNDQVFMRKERPNIFFKNIKNGKKPMPAFKDDLTDQEIWDVIFYVWTFQPSEESLAQGKIVWDEKCASCHGENGDGKGPKANELDEKAFDFTDTNKMVGENSDVFFKNITNGKKEMPKYDKKLSPGERWNVINYSWTFAFDK